MRKWTHQNSKENNHEKLYHCKFYDWRAPHNNNNNSHYNNNNIELIYALIAQSETFRFSRRATQRSLWRLLTVCVCVCASERVRFMGALNELHSSDTKVPKVSENNNASRANKSDNVVASRNVCCKQMCNVSQVHISLISLWKKPQEFCREQD